MARLAAGGRGGIAATGAAVRVFDVFGCILGAAVLRIPWSRKARR